MSPWDKHIGLLDSMTGIAMSQVRKMLSVKYSDPFLMFTFSCAACTQGSKEGTGKTYNCKSTFEDCGKAQLFVTLLNYCHSQI